MNSIGNQLSIDTPELVPIELPVAGIGSRFIAILVDYLIWTAIFIVLGLLAAIIIPALTLLGKITASWAVGIVFLIIFLFHWGYFTLFEALGGGRTPGKRVTHIRVIHRSGRPIGFVESLARNLVRFVDYLPAFYGVGLVAIFFSRQNQRLGDMVAGTIVIRDQEVDSPYWGESASRTFTAPAFTAAKPIPPPHLALRLPASNLAKLSPADLRVLEGFFARRLDMDLNTRAALANRLSQALQAKSELTIPEGVSVETFLEAVAHQLRESSQMS
ncbi:MAG TPA: RDD family protein [Terracidiphilus sp.]|nr:RDD family protein [Terracidiphilus sp.]